MTSAECNYRIGEQKMLGVVHAMRTWRCYLEGAKQVTVVTDLTPTGDREFPLRGNGRGFAGVLMGKLQGCLVRVAGGF